MRDIIPKDRIIGTLECPECGRELPYHANDHGGGWARCDAICGFFTSGTYTDSRVRRPVPLEAFAKEQD